MTSQQCPIARAEAVYGHPAACIGEQRHYEATADHPALWACDTHAPNHPTSDVARRDEQGRVVGNLCADCGVRSVDSSTQGRDSTMCGPCFEYAGWENQHSDDGHDSADPAQVSSATVNDMNECPVCRPELDPRAQPAAAAGGEPTRPRTSKCSCSTSCASTTRNVFAPGHDARLVSLLVKAVLANDIDASVAESRVIDAGGTAALVDKLRAAVRNAVERASDRNRRSVARQLAKADRQAKLTAPMLDALAHAAACEDNPNLVGVNYAPLNSIRTGTCVALLNRGLIDYVHGPLGGVVGHCPTDAGRAALAAQVSE